VINNKLISNEPTELKPPVVNVNLPKKVIANDPPKQVMSNELTAKPNRQPVKISNNKIENVEKFNSIFDDPSNENSETNIFNTKPITKVKVNNTTNKSNLAGNSNKMNHVNASNKVIFYIIA